MIPIPYDNETRFEEDLISLLTRHFGWEKEVLMYPTEEDLIRNWKEILFRNNHGIDQLNDVPLTDGEMQQIKPSFKFGDKFYKTVSADLQTVLPEIKSFSPRNIHYMHKFYQLFSSFSNLPQLVANLDFTSENGKFESDFDEISKKITSPHTGRHTAGKRRYRQELRPTDCTSNADAELLYSDEKMLRRRLHSSGYLPGKSSEEMIFKAAIPASGETEPIETSFSRTSKRVT